MMERWKQQLLDDESMWPERGKVPLEPAHADARGGIQSLVNFPMKNLSLISSAKGTVRSNHYHLSDWHYMYVLKGSFDYYWRETGTNAEPEVVRVTTGEMIFTPPMEDHATVFLEDSLLVVASRNPRDQESYEADTRRVQLIDPDTVVVP
jgi:oxalate decarboxylase/phosphoglucose isomerase-like protein (cupin superfamily)